MKCWERQIGIYFGHNYSAKQNANGPSLLLLANYILNLETFLK